MPRRSVKNMESMSFSQQQSTDLRELSHFASQLEKDVKDYQDQWRETRRQMTENEKKVKSMDMEYYQDLYVKLIYSMASTNRLLIKLEVVEEGIDGALTLLNECDTTPSAEQLDQLKERYSDKLGSELFEQDISTSDGHRSRERFSTTAAETHKRMSLALQRAKTR